MDEVGGKWGLGVKGRFVGEKWSEGRGRKAEKLVEEREWRGEGLLTGALRRRGG